MSRIWVLALASAAALNCIAPLAHGQPPSPRWGTRVLTAPAAKPADVDDDDCGVMLDITDREMPCDEEWQTLCKQRHQQAPPDWLDGASATPPGPSAPGNSDPNNPSGGSAPPRFFKLPSLTSASASSPYSGGLADFKSPIISHMNTRYFAANPDNGTLCSFGKMGKDMRYDRYGQIKGVEFSMDANQWKKRFVIDGKMLARLVGSRLLEFAGVGIDGQLDTNSKIEVTFIGTAVPKDEVIHRLNENVEALQYIEALQNRQAAASRREPKWWGGGASEQPPAPKVVLSNVIMLNGDFSKALDASIDGKLHSRVLNDGIELSLTKQNGEQMTLLSPVVRCYRTYSVELRTDPAGQPLRVAMADRHGNQHYVPQVFDLTPDL